MSVDIIITAQIDSTLCIYRHLFFPQYSCRIKIEIVLSDLSSSSTVSVSYTEVSPPVPEKLHHLVITIPGCLHQSCPLYASILTVDISPCLKERCQQNDIPFLH